MFNGLAGWQLYHGEGYGAAVTYQFDKWSHIKIIISNGIGEVYINDMEAPAMVIHEMKREVAQGKIGVEAGNFAPAYFANFQFDDSATDLKASFKQPEDPPAGTIRQWMVSEVFAEDLIQDLIEFKRSEMDSLAWVAMKSESTGITNLARISKIDKANRVFARISIQSESEQIKGLELGYSDRARVCLNERLCYKGNNGYGSRDYRYLGTIGYFDEIQLPLLEGENVLMVAVSESFGGWGVMGRMDPTGIEIK